jgi:hypothetical protein
MQTPQIKSFSLSLLVHHYSAQLPNNESLMHSTGLWAESQNITRPLPRQDNITEINGQTFDLRPGFELMVTEFERPKAVCTFSLPANVIAICLYNYIKVTQSDIKADKGTVSTWDVG